MSTLSKTDKAPNSRGLSIGKHEDKMGIRSSATSDVIMEDCEIPASALIGKEGDGFKIVMQTLDKGRVCAGASALGVARAALEHSIRYSQERIQKGKPIWKHQIIQAKLADMGMRLEAARGEALCHQRHPCGHPCRHDPRHGRGGYESHRPVDLGDGYRF